MRRRAPTDLASPRTNGAPRPLPGRSRLRSPGDRAEPTGEDPEALSEERGPGPSDLRQPLEPRLQAAVGIFEARHRHDAAWCLRRAEGRGSVGSEPAERRERSKRSCRGGSGTGAPRSCTETGAPTARSVRRRSETGNAAISCRVSPTVPRTVPAVTHLPTRSSTRVVSRCPSIGLATASRAVRAASRARPAAAALSFRSAR